MARSPSGLLENLLREFIKDARSIVDAEVILSAKKIPYKVQHISDTISEGKLVFVDTGFREVKMYRGVGLIALLTLGWLVREGVRCKLSFKGEYAVSITLISLSKGVATYSVNIQPLNEYSATTLKEIFKVKDLPVKITRVRRITGVEDIEEAALGCRKILTDIALLMEYLSAIKIVEEENVDAAFIDGSIIPILKMLGNMYLNGKLCLTRMLELLVEEAGDKSFSKVSAITKKSASKIVTYALSAFKTTKKFPLVAIPSLDSIEFLLKKGGMYLTNLTLTKKILVVRYPFMSSYRSGLPVLDVQLIVDTEKNVKIEDLVSESSRRALKIIPKLLSLLESSSYLLPKGILEVDACVRVSSQQAEVLQAEVEYILRKIQYTLEDEADKITLESLLHRDVSSLAISRLGLPTRRGEIDEYE